MTATQAALHFATALALTAVLMPPVVWMLRSFSLLDIATERSSHHGSIARGGGLALAIGVALTMVIFRDDWQAIDGMSHVLWLGGGMGLIGLVDDVASPPASLRLGLQATVAAVFVLTLPDAITPSLFLVGSAVVGLWLLSLTNAFNFMDGINGITASSAIVIGVSLAVASLRSDAGIALGAAALAGASAGFLPFNAPQARVFLGDVGSYTLGASFAALTIVGYSNGIALITIVLPFSLYLSDTGTTLLRRMRAGAPLLAAHRDHSYQRLVHHLGWSHMRVTTLTTTISVFLCVLGHVGAYNNLAAVVCVGCAALVLTGYARIASPT